MNCGTYARAQRRFAGDLPGFIGWVRKQYPDNIGLYGSSVKGYEAALVEREEKARGTLERLETRLGKKAAVRDGLLAAGQPARSVRAYEASELEPVRSRIREQRLALQWAERDLSLLREPEGRDRFRAYSRRVMALLRRTHASFEAAKAKARRR